MSSPVLEAIDIGKFHGVGAGRFQALAAVNLAIAGGELTLLTGPSGSGKTTLLSILGCMLTPSSGTVRVHGHSTTGRKPEQLAKLRRDYIGFVFQSYHLFPTLTAIDNVRIALDIRGEKRETIDAKGRGGSGDRWTREQGGVVSARAERRRAATCRHRARDRWRSIGHSRGRADGRAGR